MAEKHRSRSVARQLLTMDDVILSERKELHLYFNHEQDGSGKDERPFRREEEERDCVDGSKRRRSVNDLINFF